MMKYIQKTVAMVLLNTTFSFACTVFTASDGKTVLVGNNEDNTPTYKSYLWYNPAKDSKYGYVTWGNMKKLPEGGMNEKGLFWDAAAMPNRIPIVLDEIKENFKGYFVEKALGECATVDELLKLVAKYNLVWQEKAQILVVDATGDYAIIHSNYIIRKSDTQKAYFSLANYCLNDPNTKNFQCHRQGYAEKILRNEKNISIDLFKNILEKTAQTEVTNATLYSQICDLKNGTFHLFQKYDFETSKVINLKEELEKGERTIEIKTYFPTSIADLLSPIFIQKDYAKANSMYEEMQKSSNDKVNFGFRNLNDLGFKFIRDKKFEEAIEAFKLNLKHNPDADDALAGLACGFLANGDATNANKYFDEALAKNPNNYAALIFRPREKGKVIFKVNHFEGVEKLSIAGSFNDFKPNVNTFKKDDLGVWTCEIALKAGEYRYKFVVGDNNWYADPKNNFMVKLEKYWDNYLRVE